MGEIYISEYVSWREVVKSNTAIKHGIDNSPNEVQLIEIRRIAREVFDPMRKHFGVRIDVSSFFRSVALNRKIGNAALTSQHMCENGAAMDIDGDTFGGVTNSEIFNFIKDNLEFDQLIWEYGDAEQPDWVHVSLKASNNRGAILRAERRGGRTFYLPYAV